MSDTSDYRDKQSDPAEQKISLSVKRGEGPRRLKVGITFEWGRQTVNWDGIEIVIPEPPDQPTGGERETPIPSITLEISEPSE